MDKKKYTQAYRLSRMLHQCHLDNDRKGKRAIREIMKQSGIDFLEQLWAERSRIDYNHQEFITAYPEKIYMYNPEHTPDRNKMLNRRLFERRLREIYH